ncbi:hypothetical protein [Streptomyces sp. VN1]|uniref:hypothetical protein n=1 Tax=Streptomyces sp. VN1 TaxID=1821625 RepID=UPI001413907C|nr:hypothetical protein [Streptomyces sp. VN1]QIP74694.1 hypothetical protein EZV63_36665 [Streptomyces sp. VN1]
MHDEHQQLRPWGTVTPDFWERGQAPESGPDLEQPARPVEPAVAQQTPPPQEARRSPAVPARVETAEAAQAVTAQVAAAGPAATTGQAAAVSSSPSPDDGPPAAYQDRINAIVATFGRPDDREGLADAAIEAEELDQEFTAQYGQQHRHTVRLREIRGWLALLAGQPAVAARWYLHTTGLQIGLYGAGHAETEGSVRRAVHTWQQVKDPSEVIQTGGDLAKVVIAVLGEDSDAARYVHGRLARYQQPAQ